MELEEPINSVSVCLERCAKSIQDVESLLMQKRLIDEEEYARGLYYFRETLSLLKSRVEDILQVRRIRALSYEAENDLGERIWQLSQEKIEPRWLGESMIASDLTFRYDEKRIMIQDKATQGRSFQVTSKDIRKLLSDSLALGHYPSICVSFKADGKFNHYITPVEEIMSLIKKKSVALGRKELDEGTIRSLSTREFTDNLLNCKFPSMKIDEKQFKVWLNRLK